MIGAFCLMIMPLSAAISDTTPISFVDHLYLDLEAELNKVAPNPDTVQELLTTIVTHQSKQMTMASEALYSAVRVAFPLVATGQGELLALQQLGFNSLYLYDVQRSTLGSGFVDYYGSLKTQYAIQNTLIHISRLFNPKAIVANWKNVVRPIVIQRGLAAPTPPAPENYNNDVITLIDAEVQTIQALNLKDPLQRAAALGILSTVQLGQHVAASLGNTGVELADAFSPLLQYHLEEKAALAQLGVVSDVLEAVEASIPAQNAIDFYSKISSIYADLANYLDTHGLEDPAAYIKYYHSRRMELIEAAEGPYEENTRADKAIIVHKEASP
jgi:hypothetical protein